MIDPLYSGGSFGEVLISALQRFPDRIAFEEDGGRSVSYRETAQQIGRAIARLRALGLQPGDTVVQMSGNRCETFFVMAALYIGGFRSVTLHTLASADDQTYIIEDSEAVLVIVDPRYRERAIQLRERLSAARAGARPPARSAAGRRRESRPPRGRRRRGAGVGRAGSSCEMPPGWLVAAWGGVSAMSRWHASRRGNRRAPSLFRRSAPRPCFAGKKGSEEPIF